MNPSDDCTQNRDALRLVREGTSQKERHAPALDPSYAPVDERKIAHRMLFAKALSSFLKHFDKDDLADGDWRPFFGSDLSLQLAVAAVQDVEFYKSSVKGYLDFLNDRGHESDAAELRNHLGYLFSSAATLAKELDLLKEGLPAELALKGSLRNLVRSRLAPGFKKLLLYYRDGLDPDPPPPPASPFLEDVAATFSILGERRSFKGVRGEGLSPDWISEDGATDWADYLAHLDDRLQYPATRIYGDGATLFERVNHIATHNLFTSIFDTLLRGYARTVAEAQGALEASFKDDRHEPHYALFLAFLRLFEYARDRINTLTGRHLDFYYREVLRLKEKGALPGKVHLLVELAGQAPSFLLEEGELFQAGKDDLGIAAFFANDRDLVANQAKVAGLKTLYRHGNGGSETLPFQEGRLFAAPAAGSEDGTGGELTSPEKSWHPFYNKLYRDGALSEIRMPKAEVGFAIASHHLLLSEGKRTVTIRFTVGNPDRLKLPGEAKEGVACLFSAPKGWLEKGAATFAAEGGTLLLEVSLSGADPAVVPYAGKTHGYRFDTELPVLLVKLRHLDAADYLYPLLEETEVEAIELKVEVAGVRTLSVSNDFGAVESSKPFQPFGAQPVANSALVVGSREAFQKNLSGATLNVLWQSAPAPYGKDEVDLVVEYLQEGSWQPSGIAPENIVPGGIIFELPVGGVSGLSFAMRPGTGLFTGGAGYRQSFAIWPPESPAGTTPLLDLPELSEPEYYGTSSRQGFVRLRLADDFGQSQFEQDLISYVKNVIAQVPESQNPKPTAPKGPFLSEITLDYGATQRVDLTNSDPSLEASGFRFLHIAPFGHADQTENNDLPTFLLPQMSHANESDRKLPAGAKVRHQAEFYIGVAELKPPQNLALLFEVADGTADPLSEKPRPHIHWSYLAGNRWISFPGGAVEDGTGELLKSGIVTFALPRDASDQNSILPAGMQWIRGAVASESDAVCRLRLVAAQGLEATFSDRGNDPAFPAKVLPAGTIAKLEHPDAAVKGIGQPFPSFGGRGREGGEAFRTRVSERLRHKERGIALWDYERLVLEGFPQIYKAKCLNHVQYEPNESGTGIYRELAPGHVTVVTIPDQQFQNLRDPFRPYTSLGLLEEIAAYLGKRTSCFVSLHVKNPQFEEVRADFKVRLHPGLDETFHKNRLNEAVSRFLSPWAFPGGGTPSFGGRVYKSVLINFVEEQPYVDYLTDFRLWHRFPDHAGVLQTVEKDEVEGSRAVSILVSAGKHDIETLNPAEEGASGEKCPCAA